MQGSLGKPRVEGARRREFGGDREGLGGLGVQAALAAIYQDLVSHESSCEYKGAVTAISIA